MTNITLPVLYHRETVGSGSGPRLGQTPRTIEAVAPVGNSARSSIPQRQAPFLAQLIVGNDPDFRKALGRTDIARAREAAYTTPKTTAALAMGAKGILA